MYAIYGNMDPVNIPPMLAYIPAPWIHLFTGIYTIGQSTVSQRVSVTRPEISRSR